MLSAFSLEKPIKKGKELQLKLKPKCCFKNKLQENNVTEICGRVDFTF